MDGRTLALSMYSAVAAVYLIAAGNVKHLLPNPRFIPDSCTDDPNFIDSHGHKCSDWVGKDCSLHCPLEKCHYPGDFTPEEVKIVRDTCPVSCGTCTSYHEVPHAPLFSCNVWNGGSVHVEECRPGLDACVSVAMRIKLFTNQGFENQREIDDLWEGVGMCYNKTEDTCESIEAKLAPNFVSRLSTSMGHGGYAAGSAKLVGWGCETCTGSRCNEKHAEMLTLRHRPIDEVSASDLVAPTAFAWAISLVTAVQVAAVAIHGHER